MSGMLKNIIFCLFMRIAYIFQKIYRFVFILMINAINLQYRNKNSTYKYCTQKKQITIW